MKRIVLLSVCGIVFLGALGHILFYEHAKNAKFRQMREELMAIAAKSSPSIDAAALARIPLTMEGDKTPEYKEIYDTLVEIKEAYPVVKYAYILTTTDQPEIMQFVVDADPLPEIVTARSQRSFPGDKYDVRHLTEIRNAFSMVCADRNINADAWGVTLSGYAPINGPGGKAVAILCIDMDASSVYAYQNAVRPIISLLWALAVAAVIVVIGDLVLRRKKSASAGPPQKP
ncbi:MAG: hypothetical protein PHG72_05470 [Candidatus Omnitrophica bacterium]|nr:hypothetical protein [Candidatus Omnitrophota bacterium]